MTIDRAIEILRDDANSASLWELAEAVDMAIEALKEQGEREKERAFAEHLRDRGY